MALLLAGCGVLPARPELPVTTARPPAIDGTLARIARASQPDPELSGFRLMPLGIFSLDARIELAQRAQFSLDVQYYHLQDDNTGRLLLRSLRDAAQRGVRVRLLVDDLYTTGADGLFRSFAGVENVEVRLFNPFCCGRTSLGAKYASSLWEFQRLNHRMHNKLYIADGVMAIAGGRNIADEYFMRHKDGNFVDMDAFIIGAVVPQLAHIFDDYWNSKAVYPVETIIASALDNAALRADFDRRVDDGEQMMHLTLPPVDVLGYGAISEDLDAGRLGLLWGKAIAFADPPGKAMAASDDEARAMSVTMGVMDRVMAAKSEVVLSSPYFIPGVMGAKVFTDLRARDVKVTVLTNSLGATDEPLVHTGYARYRFGLLKSGVDLYELSSVRIQSNRRLGFLGGSLGRLHAKTAVIDRTTVFIGSMNLDPRSASKNTELGLLIDSPQLAREVLRVINLSKLQSAYRVRIADDGVTLNWLGMDDEAEVVLLTEPDSSFWMRLHGLLLGPFVPEQQL